MIIVLEGPDGAGKSTLAQEFVRRGFELRYHDDPPKPGEDKFERYIKIVEMIASSQNVVIDRFAPSEYIYSHVLRPDAIQISLGHVRLVNRLLYAKGALTIFCLPPYETVEANWRARHADELVKHSDHLSLIYHAYERLFESEYSKLHALKYNYQRDDISVLFERPMATAITKFSIPYLQRSLPESLIGFPEARFLILGERSTERRDLAFLSLKKSSSASYLNDALWEAGYAEHELCFTNAFTHEGYQRSIRKLYDGRIVIAFGNLAQTTCDEQGVPHLRMFHPQYWKRFQAKRRDEYVAELRMYRGER